MYQILWNSKACLSVHCRSFSPWSTAASCHRISRQVVAGSTAIIIIFYEHHHRFLSLLLEQCGFFLFGVMGGRNYVDRRPDVKICLDIPARPAYINLFIIFCVSKIQTSSFAMTLLSAMELSCNQHDTQQLSSAAFSLLVIVTIPKNKAFIIHSAKQSVSVPLVVIGSATT